MILYKFLVSSTKAFLEDVKQNERTRNKSFDEGGIISDINKKFNSIYKVDKKNLLVVTDCADGKFTVVLAYKAKVIDIEQCTATIKDIIPSSKIVSEEEITLEEFSRELTRANERSWISRSADYYLREMNLRLNPENFSFFDGPSYVYKEVVYSDKGLTKKKTLAMLDDIMASKSFYEEIERIYSSDNKKKFIGHPVHYLITAGDKAAADEMVAILVAALMKNKRLLGGRVCDVEKMTSKAYREENFNNIFVAAQGSTVVINLSIDGRPSQFASSYHELTEHIARKMGEYGNDTLFIFVDVSGSRNISDEAMGTILSNADMIHISEGHGDITKARDYLSRLAHKTDFDDIDVEDLVKHLPEDKADYTVSDIYSAYNRWYGRGLKTHVYRAYKEKDIVKIERNKQVNKPYEELQNMIGLTDVKRVTDEILAAARMKKIRERMGLENTGTSMHMLFSGNPGTAKTTVARLLSQILKDEEVLKNGHIVECGRQDLVGKYVGWTAKTVEEKFRAARGGILFIDEAYSLVEDHNSFGTEAINTIVQMMENYRDEVIVIFAGYPEKMQEFIEQNEGLRSRIAFHLNFPDYNSEELTQIMELMVKNLGYKTDDSALEKCKNIYAEATATKDFGNGRYVRNLLEHSIMRQANRLCKVDSKSISKDDAITLVADDFEVIGMKKEQKNMGLLG